MAMNFTDSKKPKCLVIHGFGGGVYEIESLVNHLIGLNYDVISPTLKGHSATKKEMKEATYIDWIESAERELQKMHDNNDEVLVLGFSMGGLIAFNLASKYNIKAIVTINTPIFYWNLAQVIHNLVDDIKNRNIVNIKRYLQAKQNSPISSMRQFLFLLNQTKSKLEEVKCPLLIIQAKDDDTSRRKSVDYIYNHVSSAKKNIKYYNEGGHQILQSSVSEQVFSCVDDFIQNL
jgi:carboxylesterase